MVTYDFFVHPGFPGRSPSIRESSGYKTYTAELENIAKEASCAIHVADPRLCAYDNFLGSKIGETRRVFSHEFRAPPIVDFSYGAVSANDWNKFVGMLRGARPYHDSFRIHGSYHGCCTLDLAVQLYGILYQKKQWVPRVSPRHFFDEDFPFREQEIAEIYAHVIQAHFLNSNIRLGVVFSDHSNPVPQRRISFIRQFSEKASKVYTPESHP